MRGMGNPPQLTVAQTAARVIYMSTIQQNGWRVIRPQDGVCSTEEECLSSPSMPRIARNTSRHGSLLINGPRSTDSPDCVAALDERQIANALAEPDYCRATGIPEVSTARTIPPIPGAPASKPLFPVLPITIAAEPNAASATA